MSFDDYKAIDAVNWSTLKRLLVSPFAYQWALKHPADDTDAMRLGRATHCAVFEPDNYAVQFAVWTGGRRASKAWDEFCEANQDRTIITEDQHRIACGIRDAVRAHPVAKTYLERGAAELPLEWDDHKTRVHCKARLDFNSASPSGILDLKTTSHGIGPKEFAATCANQAYHGQLAHYRNGAVANELTAEDTPCILIAATNSAPFEVAVWTLDEDTVWRGEQLVGWLLDRYVECRSKNEWPGAYQTEGLLALPGWYRQPNEDDNEGGWPRGLELPEEAA